MTENDTSTSESEETATNLGTCAVCGTAIDTGEWHPVVTEHDENDEIQVYAFCSQACRDEWSSADG